jgi:hypothetical protein
MRQTGPFNACQPGASEPIIASTLEKSKQFIGKWSVAPGHAAIGRLNLGIAAAGMPTVGWWFLADNKPLATDH